MQQVTRTFSKVSNLGSACDSSPNTPLTFAYDFGTEATKQKYSSYQASVLNGFLEQLRKIPSGFEKTPGHLGLMCTESLKNVEPGVFYKTKICPWFSKGKCTYGRACSFAHTLEELRPQPNLYKIRMCPTLINTGSCTQQLNCRYAHNVSELQRTPWYKTQICRHHAQGSCAAGGVCRYAHGEEELRCDRA